MNSTVTRSLTVSVVSHGHGVFVQRLLGQLSQDCWQTIAKVVLTQNIEEPLPQSPANGWPFELEVVRPARALGFGANHNHAFSRCRTEFFCVLNPDIELCWGNPFDRLMAGAKPSNVALAYPIQMVDAHTPLDSERDLPTPWALFRRYTLGARRPVHVAWVNGACMVFRSDVFGMLGGFDARFRLYCEDVELCLRARQQGFRLQAVPVKILHAAQKASHKSVLHLFWHAQSLLRLWGRWAFWSRPKGRPEVG